MDLLHKLAEYEKLKDIQIILTLSLFNNEVKYEIDFNTYGFPHLIGLGKYSSINRLKMYNEKRISAKTITKDIRKGKISYKTLEKTNLWSDSDIGCYLKMRIDAFDFERVMELLQNEVVIFFDKEKLKTEFDADVIMFDRKSNLYFHLSAFIKNNNFDKLVVSSFFIASSDKYIRSQTSVPVVKIDVRKKGSLEIVFSKEFSS